MNKRIKDGASLKQPQKLERSSKAYRIEETLKSYLASSMFLAFCLHS